MLDPLTVTGIIKWELRQAFQEDKIEMQQNEDLVWRPDPNDPEEMDVRTTGIIIEPAELPRREVTGVCPQILIKRGNIRATMLGLNHNQYIGVQFPTGGVQHAGLYEGSWDAIVSCVDIGVCERAAWEAFLYLTRYEKPIAKYYKFTKFRAAALSEVGVTSESEQPEYAVVIQLEIAFNSGWEVAEQAPRLKNIRPSSEEWE